MPVTDEDIIRELLHRYTEHVYPAASTASEVMTRQRRRDRRRALSLLAAGTALGTAAGVTALAPRPSPPGPASAAPAAPGNAKPASSPQPSLRLTADQRVLYQLSSVAARQAPGQGRYVVMSTEDTYVRDTTVIDSLTGDMWSYQKGTDGSPSGKGYTAGYSATAAQLARIPTSPAALRAVLIAEWDKSLATGIPQPAARTRLSSKLPRNFSGHPRPLVHSDDDKVFQQASYLLWNPLVSPSLRSALFKVLAAVPGVRVDPSARDRLGRPAVELSRADDSGLTSAKPDGQVFVTFQSPATGAVLESTVTSPANGSAVTPQQPHGGSPVVAATVYLSITWADSVPGNPYGGS